MVFIWYVVCPECVIYEWVVYRVCGMYIHMLYVHSVYGLFTWCVCMLYVCSVRYVGVGGMACGVYVMHTILCCICIVYMMGARVYGV